MIALNYYEYPKKPNSNPTYLMILINGYASIVEDLISLDPEVASEIGNIQFVSPDAPFEFEGGGDGFQWYSLLDRSPRKMIEGTNIAEPILNSFIDTQLARFRLDDSKLILCGFSQGGMLSIHCAMKRARPCAAVISFSGYILDNKNLENEINSRPYVLLSHGQEDQVVPFDTYLRTRDRLESLKVPITTHVSPGLAHGIDFSCICAAKKFLLEKLDQTHM